MKTKQLKLICPLCEGSGWLCDDHPTLPWSHADDCEAGGVACRCNTLAAQQHNEVFVDDDDAPDDAPAVRRPVRSLARW